MTARVSICTSVLNQTAFLKRQIESVRAQTFQEWEHIIVDDGSTEDIKTLVESFQDPRLVYIRFPENRGFQAGYNHALSLASGDYVELLAADEFLWERKLEVQVAWMDEHPLIGCTWGLPTPNIGQPWELGGPRAQWEQYAQKAHNRSREAWIRTLLTLDNIPIGGASMLMRRECYKTIGGFDPRFTPLSDLELFVRFFMHYQGWILPYRLADAAHPENRKSMQSAGQFQDDLRLLQTLHKVKLPPVTGSITIGMPVRNMEKYIARAVNSIVAQTFKDWKLVIFDDASTDSTRSVLQKISDPRVKVIFSEENVGVAAAQNHMLGTCDTEFFMLLAADDTIESTLVERCLAEYIKNPFLEMVSTLTDFIDVEDKPAAADHPFWRIQRPGNKPRELWLQQLYFGNQYFGASVYRTAALQDIGGWDTGMGVVADWDVYVKLLQRENIHVIEEVLTHTRVHDQQRSQLKTREEVVKLRLNYHEGHVRYWPPRAKLIIATPFYEMRGFSPYIVSLVQTSQLLASMGVQFEFWELSGDSYVDRAKNTLYNKFLEDPDATDLLIIDSDMQWNPQAVFNLLQFPEQIVQGSYPQKNAWSTWTAKPLMHDPGDGIARPFGRNLPDGSALIKAEYLAGGFLRVKRQCLELYREKYTDYWYYDAGADPSYPDRKYTEFFTCERARMDPANAELPQLRWGEDRVFGRRMQAIGVDSWIYPNIDFGHYGVNGWMGNYDKFLKTPRPAPEQQGKAA